MSNLPDDNTPHSSEPLDSDIVIAPLRRPEIRVRQVLFLLAGLCFTGIILTLLATKILEYGLGWDLNIMTGQLPEGAPDSEVWKMRFVAGLNQIMVFLLPSLACIYVFRNVLPELPAGVSLRRFPYFNQLAFSIVLLIAAMPVVFYSYQINKLIPVPQSMQDAADQATAAIKALMRMPNIWTLLANMLLVAVIPAFGEELLFRGIVQRQLMRRMLPAVAIIITGALFSLMHFQIDGFLPRWILGMLLGWVYWRTNNFWVPVLLHFLNNGFQILAQYLHGQDLSSVDLSENDVEVPILAAVVAVAVMVLVGREMGKQRS
jgi:uncharacterized protein